VSVPPIPDLLVTHWQADPSILVPAATASGLYLWGVRRVRGRWPVRRTLAFLAGVAGVVVALQSGLGTYDDVLLSAHMVQHVILLLLAPLLLLWGRPVMLALRALPRGGRAGLGSVTRRLRFLGHWSVGLLVFNAVVLVPHIPALYDASLRHPLVHDLQHLIFLFGGMIFLWPLFGAPAGRGALGSVGGLCYVIASMPACAVAGAYLNQATAVVYAHYAAVDHTLGLSAVNDQRQAGAIMWVGAHLILTFVALWVLGSKLVAEERRQRVRDLLEDRSAVSAGAREGGELP
jgi:cytochrome c oxidase assembly factor CtaG